MPRFRTAPASGLERAVADRTFVAGAMGIHLTARKACECPNLTMEFLKDFAAAKHKHSPQLLAAAALFGIRRRLRHDSHID
jgi:hypothetical protein